MDKDLEGIMKSNRSTKQEVLYQKALHWFNTLSERTLSLASIATLHVIFLPNALAYLNGLTEKLPNLDAYLLLIIALVIMNVRSIIKNDKIAALVHTAGFVSQLAMLALILLK